MPQLSLLASPADWVITKEFLTGTEDQQHGFVFSNGSKARRKLVIKEGEQFIGVGGAGNVLCEGYCLTQPGLEDSPLVSMNELFGVWAMVYRYSKKIFKLDPDFDV
jgi:hypothetical protein